MDDPDDPADEFDAFRGKPAWQRIIVLCAGSATHFLLALLLVFGLALSVGIANVNTQLATISPCVPANLKAYDNNTCTGSDPVSPAKQAGLQAGDVVTAFDGKPVTTWDQLSDAILAAPAWEPVTITVQRHGRLLTLDTTTAAVSGRAGSYLGIGPSGAYVFLGTSPLGAVEYAGSTFGQVLVGSAQAAADLPAALPKLFDGKERATVTGGQVTSIYGAAQATGAYLGSNVGWQYKVSFVLLLIASLNIFVGAFNMLPLLPMDGGHVAAIIYERIRAWLARLRGRPNPGLADISKFLPISFALFMVIVCFALVLVAADIVNPLNITGG